jgi:hypothetical protein
MPVMQEFYSAYMRHGTKSKMSEAVFMQSGSRMMSGGMESKRVPISPITRDSFFQAFGMTPDEQRATEEYYRNWNFEFSLRDVDIIDDINTSPL